MPKPTATAEPEPEADVPELLAREIELVPLDAIQPHPANPNKGDPDAIGESVDRVGFYQVVFVQRSTGRILAGEHRWRTLAAKGSPVVPVVYLDVDDAAALSILVGDNEIPRQHSRPDDRALVAALQQLKTSPEGLSGTGWDDEGLRVALARLADPTPPPQFPDAEALAGHIEHRCPSCGYEWSGSPTPKTGAGAPERDA